MSSKLSTDIIEHFKKNPDLKKRLMSEAFQNEHDIAGKLRSWFWEEISSGFIKKNQFMFSTMASLRHKTDWLLIARILLEEK